MKVHLYKVLPIYREYEPVGFENVVNTMVMTESDLRKEFLSAVNDCVIPKIVLDDYKTDPDYSRENWNDVESLSPGTMVDIMNDLCNYDCNNYYIIDETDITIGE